MMRCKIERERTIPAKCDPKTFRQWCGCRNVIRIIFRGRDCVVNFDAVCRKRVRIALVVRPRMINHRVLPKIEDRQRSEEKEANTEERANYSAWPGSDETAIPR